MAQTETSEDVTSPTEPLIEKNTSPQSTSVVAGAAGGAATANSTTIITTRTIHTTTTTPPPPPRTTSTSTTTETVEDTDVKWEGDGNSKETTVAHEAMENLRRMSEDKNKVYASNRKRQRQQQTGEKEDEAELSQPSAFRHQLLPEQQQQQQGARRDNTDTNKPPEDQQKHSNTVRTTGSLGAQEDSEVVLLPVRQRHHQQQQPLQLQQQQPLQLQQQQPLQLQQQPQQEQQQRPQQEQQQPQQEQQQQPQQEQQQQPQQLQQQPQHEQQQEQQQQPQQLQQQPQQVEHQPQQLQQQPQQLQQPQHEQQQEQQQKQEEQEERRKQQTATPHDKQETEGSVPALSTRDVAGVPPPSDATSNKRSSNGGSSSTSCDDSVEIIYSYIVKRPKRDDYSSISSGNRSRGSKSSSSSTSSSSGSNSSRSSSSDSSGSNSSISKGSIGGGAASGSSSSSSSSNSKGPLRRLYPLSICSWNVNSLPSRVRDKRHWQQFVQWVLATEPDVLCMQEVKMAAQAPPSQMVFVKKDIQVDVWKPTWSENVCVQVQGVRYNLAGGTPSSQKQHDPEGRIICIDFMPFVLLATYSPNNGGSLKSFERRRQWDNKLYAFVQKLEKPLIWAGDLNCAPEDVDLSDPGSFRAVMHVDAQGRVIGDPDDIGQAGCTNSERRRFKEILQAGDLVDAFRERHRRKDPPPIEAAEYSWRGRAESTLRLAFFGAFMLLLRPYVTSGWGGRGVRGVFKGLGMRIDHIIISRALLPAVEEARISGVGTDMHNFFGSDHCPILLRFKEGAFDQTKDDSANAQNKTE